MRIVCTALVSSKWPDLARGPQWYFIFEVKPAKKRHLVMDAGAAMVTGQAFDGGCVNRASIRLMHNWCNCGPLLRILSSQVISSGGQS